MLVALSAVIVVTYAGVRIAARPPEVADHTPASNDGDSTAGATGSPAPRWTPDPAEGPDLHLPAGGQRQVSGNTDTMMALTYDTVNQTADWSPSPVTP